MGGERWFYRNTEEWNAIADQLKLTPCPHCKAVGMLIRHGTLQGFDESNPPRKVVRARRVFCSDRNARHGCGRTFSIWLADKIRRLSLTTRALWKFLKNAVGEGIAAAIRGADCPRSDRTLQRVWKRFNQAQSQLRTALTGRCPPPRLSDGSHPPAAEVLAHLQVAFPGTDCPIAAFQQTLRIFFL
jgi:hypothetical protein